MRIEPTHRVVALATKLPSALGTAIAEFRTVIPISYW